jgi:hypothetical protein
MATHLDVELFEELWKQGLCSDPDIVESRDEQVRYTKKEHLRRRLMDIAVERGIVHCKSAEDAEDSQAYWSRPGAGWASGSDGL